MFKVGKQLFTHAGPQAVRLIQELGGEIFLDLKFTTFPAPSPRRHRSDSLRRQDVQCPPSGSLEMMRTTVKEVRRVCRQEQRRRPIMLGGDRVDELESRRSHASRRRSKVADQVVRLALLTKQAGMDGVVASPMKLPISAKPAAAVSLLSLPV